MTLILALRYRDGLLLASDSQMTADRQGQPTKAEAQKLFVLNGRIGWGASGGVGLTQRITYELEADAVRLAKVFDSRGAEDGAREVFSVVNALQRKAAEAFVPNVGRQQDSVGCLFVGYGKGTPFILEVDRGGLREFVPLPYAAIGSGDIFAVHAIRSVAHYNIAALSREQALALAYRTIDNAIQTAAFGLGGKVQLLCVTPEKAWILDDNEVKASQDMVDIWKGKEVETLGALSLPITQVKPAMKEPPSE